MYQNTYTSLIYKDKVLPEIPTTKGVKQGDTLKEEIFTGRKFRAFCGFGQLYRPKTKNYTRRCRKTFNPRN